MGPKFEDKSTGQSNITLAFAQTANESKMYRRLDCTNPPSAWRTIGTEHQVVVTENVRKTGQLNIIFSIFF